MSPDPATRKRLRHVPNALSMARIVAVPVLLLLAWQHQQTWFAWVLVPALFTDLADGWLARTYHLESKRGAFLDSVGDTLLLVAAMVGVWTFHREVITGNALLCGTMIGLWLLENVAALLRYGRLSSFHTYLSKTAGYLLSVYVGVLFVFGDYPWLLKLAAGLSIVGSLEEFALLAVLPKWRTDVQGLSWVLAEPRKRR
jgi:CDP-diacylglycerol--glycerol-3-phosphate 3-phosphatidyltransferase